jgi:hypothetical protein
MKSQALLWAGIFAGPAAWFLQLEANFALAPLACSGRGKVAMYCVSAAALTLTVLGGGISLGQRHISARDTLSDQVPARSRRRTMALAGIGLSALFILVIAAQTIPNLLMQGCE